MWWHSWLATTRAGWPVSASGLRAGCWPDGPDAQPGQAAEAAGCSGQAGERGAAVVGNHVGQRRDNVDRRAWRGAVQLSVGTEQVARDAFRAEPLREAAPSGLAGGLERG